MNTRGWAVLSVAAVLGASLAIVGCEKKEEAPAGSFQQMGEKLDAAAKEGEKAATEGAKTVEETANKVQEGH